jgi:hypothetical protein
MTKQDAKNALASALVDALGPQVPADKSAALCDTIVAYIDAAIADNNAAKQNV